MKIQPFLFVLLSFTCANAQGERKSLHMMTEIHSRFAVTNLGSIVENPTNFARQTEFTCFIPENAFISNFTMEINGEMIVGEVKEKEVAEREYKAAVSRGESAGHVFKRGQNEFAIEVAVEPRSQTIFILTYQEVLRRVLGAYKHVLHIPRREEMEDLQVDVVISERVKISFIHVPELKPNLGLKNNKELADLPPSATVEPVSYSEADGSLAYLTYSPNDIRDPRVEDKDLVILYDVERSGSGGEMQVVDGYFIHYIAPDMLPEGEKHVVFVLDKSGSMRGRKIVQLQNAMDVILHDLSELDFFSVIMFGSDVTPWKTASVQATPENVEAATRYIRQVRAGGGTNIMDSLQKGIEQLKNLITNPPQLGGGEWQPLASMIIFLTDGLPTFGSIKDPDQIVDQVTTLNDEAFSIHCIAFGKGADYEFTKKLAITNFGLARRVYEASDAEFQIEGFYEEIGNPALIDTQVRYLEGTVDLNSLVGGEQQDLSKGGELVRAGKLSDDIGNRKWVRGTATGTAKRGTSNAQFTSRAWGRVQQQDDVKCLNPLPGMTDVAINKAVNSKILCDVQADGVTEGPSKFSRIPYPPNTIGGFVERTWAYMTVKKRLEQAKYEAQNPTEAKQFRDKALQMSLEYNFVTELTSMVVTQPDGTEKKPDITSELLDKPKEEGGSPQGPQQSILAKEKCKLGIVFIYDDTAQCKIIEAILNKLKLKVDFTVSLVQIGSFCIKNLAQASQKNIRDIVSACSNPTQSPIYTNFVNSLTGIKAEAKKVGAYLLSSQVAKRLCVYGFGADVTSLKNAGVSMFGAALGYEPSAWEAAPLRDLTNLFKNVTPGKATQDLAAEFLKQCPAK